MQQARIGRSPNEPGSVPKKPDSAPHKPGSTSHVCARPPDCNSSLPQVDVYDSRSTREAFEGARRRFEGGGFTAEQWVFHTVSDEPALRSLMCNGFQVGGADGGVAMAGSDGVYVADGPSTPRHRRNVPASIGQEKIVLARVLLGRTQSRSLMRPATETAPLDSWRPRDDWVVFRQSDQLLPIYVLHF